ncbi:uncharacterized protein LOC132839207 [Tachysurus vachellii]|uniref:uncharacterized protein LOC132839207 n=1 Tax=Tachysurus vachellii TaxID=175792 RepID=UPI00296AE866|nr:uncharacterized protein LOC132839207 [Tachysurus vachellii]
MKIKGKPDWSVEMLMLLVVLTLVPTWSDGLLLKKCELRSQLEAAFSELLGEKAADIIAKLACTVEQTSGFSTSLVNITDQYEPRSLNLTLEDFSSAMGELPLISNDTNILSEVFSIKVDMTEEPLIPQHTAGEDEFIPGRVEVQPEKSVDNVDGQFRKKRDAPTNDERDGSWRSVDSPGEGSTDQSEETQENNGLDETVIPQILPDPKDTNEMLFGSTVVPNDRTKDTEDIYYNTYEMLLGPIIVPSDRTAEPEATMKRSTHSSEDQTTLYGIFQLSDIACNSGPSYGLCGLDCSALTDDDITDDIACLMTMDEKGRAMGFTQECASVEPSHYFAECG